MIINIIAGSPTFNPNLLHNFKVDVTIGVDYGAFVLVDTNNHIDYAIGDFDSINEKQLLKIKMSCPNVYQYKSEKDETDTELAINFALQLNALEINLFGVTGKRIDHFLGVMNLFKKFTHNSCQLNIIDDYNKIYLIKPGTTNIKKSYYKYISFFAYDQFVSNLTLINFKYELLNYNLQNIDSLTISNEIKEDYGIVKFDEGILLIVESND